VQHSFVACESGQTLAGVESVGALGELDVDMDQASRRVDMDQVSGTGSL
jgi:hypothetical protein